MNFREVFRPAGGMAFRCPSILAQMASLNAFALPAEGSCSENERAALGEMDPLFGYGRNPDPESLPYPTRYGSPMESAITVARVLVEGGEFTRASFARMRIDEFKRSSATKRALRQRGRDWKGIRPGEEEAVLLNAPGAFEDVIVGATILGVLPTINEVFKAATAMCTVWRPAAMEVFAARTVALATYWSFHRSEPLEKMWLFLSDALGLLEDDCKEHGGSWSRSTCARVVRGEDWPWHTPVLAEASSLDIVRAALALARERTDSVGADMRLCLRPGGCVGSVMAVAAAIKAPRRPFEELPPFLARDLECGDPTTGTARLLELGGALMEKYA